MAEKKISDLTNKENINNDDEFVFVDKATTSGTDAGVGGQTSKIKFSDLKTAVGTSGPQGSQGPQGVPGNDSTVEGPQGPQGVPGNDSTVVGPQGPQGVPGNDSTVVGPQGPQGVPGNDSTVVGPQGPQGPKGNDSTVVGPQGPQGSKGDNSTVAGPQGPKGDNSTVAGPQGPKGDKGDPGSDSVVDFPKCAGHVKFTGDQVLGGNTGNLGIADHQFNIHSVVDEGTGKYKVLFGTKFGHTNFPAVVSSTGFDVGSTRFAVTTMLDAQDGKDSNGLFGGKAVQFIHARDAWNGPFQDPARVHLVVFDENGD